ncbi:MAG: NAD-dependent epimerase/dehydratase family protein, partial [Bacteroidota bacterium]
MSLSFVNGVNGHLGYNLVRYLLDQGLAVRASARKPEQSPFLQQLDCELIASDITDKASLLRALQGVETCYAVGAVFRLWAADPQAEIYEPNLLGTRNLIEAAAEAGVKRIVYVSSIAALDTQHSPMRERNGYNPDRRNAYFNSKNDGEQLAFQLAKKLGIELVAVLPSAMIGSESPGPLSYSYELIRLILAGEVPVETGISLNW